MKVRLRTVVALLLTTAAFWWVFRGIDSGELLGAVREANYVLLSAAALAATLIFPIRARRWQTILAPVADRVPFIRLWKATAIGFALNNTLPARLGEVARAYALARSEPRVTFAAAFASLAVDRLFDAVVLLLLLLIGALAVPATAAGAEGVQLAIRGGIVLVTVLLAGLYSLALFPAQLIRAYELFARRLVPSLEARGSSILQSVAGGVSVLRSPVRFLAVLLWSVLHWLVHAAAFWIGFRAFGIEVPFAAALVTQGLVAFGVALPQGPGYLGTFQGLAKVGLMLFGVSETAAVAFGFGYWLASFLPITAIGLAYFSSAGLTLAELRGVVVGGAAATNSGNAPSGKGPSG